MSHRRTYDIAFVGLKPGTHVFEYDIDDTFFAEDQAQEFQNCNAHVRLTLDKHTGFLMLKFEVGGTMEVTCDRCGNKLPLNLWDEFHLIVKMAENPEELNEAEEDPDVYYISRTESHLHVAKWIYEFIILSVPMQRMCSEEEMGGPYCNKEVLALLKQLDVPKTNERNPVWKGLEQFKNLKK